MSVRGNLKQLAGETIVYGIPTVFLRLLGFITIPIFTRMLSPVDYGVLGMTASMTALMVGIVMLGLDSATMILFFQTNRREDQEQTVASWIFPYLALSGSGSLILALCSPWLAATFLGGRANLDIVCLVALAQFLTGLSMVSNLVFRLQRLKWYVVGLSVAQGLTSTACSLVFVAVLKLGVRGIYYSQVLTGVVFFLLNLWILRQWLKPGFFSAKRFLELLKLGIPVVPAYLAFWVISLTDRFFVQHYRGLTDVGLINIAQSLSLAVAFICQAFQQAVNPFALSIKDEPKAGQTYSRILTYFLLITSAAAVGLSIFTPELLALLTPKSYHAAGSVVAFYAFASISGGVGFIAGIGIGISKKTHHVGWTGFAAAALSVALNFILVPHYGMVGAAISALVSQWVGAFLLFAMAQRCHHIPYHWNEMAVILISSVVAIGLSWQVQSFGFWTAIAFKLGCLILFLLPVFLFRIVTFRQARDLLTEAGKRLGWRDTSSATV